MIEFLDWFSIQGMRAGSFLFLFVGLPIVLVMIIIVGVMQIIKK
jgi:hypothetical protein